jgi:hypothetical protein
MSLFSFVLIYMCSSGIIKNLVLATRPSSKGLVNIHFRHRYDPKNLLRLQL